MAFSEGRRSHVVPQSASRYVPALDGLRAVSILLVVTAHTEVFPFVPGGFGVTLFFFVSGYLLTGQMIAEYDRRNTISFRGFYSRRALRLLPAAFAYILIAGLFFGAIGGTNTVPGWLAAIFYGANYFDVFVHYQDTVGQMHEFVRNPFDILWSLAVEEHFYFLWPSLLMVTLTISRRRRIGPIIAVLLVCIRPAMAPVSLRRVVHTAQRQHMQSLV
jgi:peptidoglycan/LPS O-acetylase OafA/YrhL